MSEHTKTDFTVQYTMDGVGYNKIVSGKSEEDAKETFLEEMKKGYPESCESIVVTSVENTKDAAKTEAKEAKDAAKEAKHKAADEK